ncbi:MAG: HAD family hydrolase [Pseudomonadota bacterium]
MSVRLVALDIDGTLLAPGVSHDAVPDQTMTRAITGLMEAGVVVVLATGRMYPGTVRIAQHLGVTSPLVCQQGASTHHLDGSLLQWHSIDPDIAHELAEFAENAGWPYAWFDAHRYLVSAPNAASQHFADVSDISVELHESPRHSGVTATGIDIISTTDHAADIHRELDARYGQRVELLDFSSVTAVHSPNASKGLAVAEIAADLGITQAEVLAVGDSANDVSMLEWAGHSAAPAHCDRYARTAAREVVSGDGVDGVARLLHDVLNET